jgi:hypothetical protein
VDQVRNDTPCVSATPAISPYAIHSIEVTKETLQGGNQQHDCSTHHKKELQCFSQHW